MFGTTIHSCENWRKILNLKLNFIPNIKKKDNGRGIVPGRSVKKGSKGKMYLKIMVSIYYIDKYMRYIST